MNLRYEIRDSKYGRNQLFVPLPSLKTLCGLSQNTGSEIAINQVDFLDMGCF